LWNLDEEPAANSVPPPRVAASTPAQREEPEVPAPPAKSGAPAPRAPKSPARPTGPRPVRPDEIGELDESEPLVAAAPAKEPAARAEPMPPPAIEPVPAEPEPAVVSAPKENRPRPSAAASASLPRPRLNRREVLGMASFAVVALIAGLWVLTRFFSQLSFTSDSAGQPDYPLEGALARVASAETFWRQPIREGTGRDVARREVVIIPVLELTLDPEQSGGGALRVIFRNSEGEPLGDPITRSFGAGRFEASGSATIAFPATDGFTADGDFQAYRTGKGKLWTADVLEGPSADASANSFKKLSSIPLLPLRR
jgi:hypothetical protein